MEALIPDDEEERLRQAQLDAEIAALAAQPAPLNGLEQLQQLIAARKPAAEGPGSEELRYLAENRPQAGWKNVLGAVGSAIAESTGSRGALDRFQGAQNQAQQRYQAGLDAARGIDLGRRPVDAGTAELLLLGGMTPEAAEAAQRDSQAVKLAQSGMGQLGARYRQMDLAAAKAEADRVAKEQLQAQRIEHQDERAADSIASREKIAAMKKKGGGAGAALSPEQKAERDAKSAAGRAALLAARTNVSEAEAAAFDRGETVDLPPAKLEDLRIAKGLIDSGMLDTSKAALNIFNRDASELDAPGKAAAVKGATGGADKKERLKLKSEYGDLKADVTSAISAWNSMSPTAKLAFAQLAGAGGDIATAAKQAKLSPQDQANAGALMALANVLIKARAGSAVTGSEWNRVAQEIGFPTGDWSIFNSTAGISAWLRKAKASAVRRRQAIESEYPGLFSGGEAQ